MNPDDLLQQIQDLLQQYLQLGPDTPVAAQAQQLSDAIDAQAAGGDQGGMGPESALSAMSGAGAMGGGPDDESKEPFPDNEATEGDLMGPQPGEPPANAGHKTFGAANISALDRLKKRNANAKSKSKA